MEQERAAMRRRRKSPETYFTEEAAATAVLYVLQLQQQSIRICEVELWSAALGAAAIRHAQRDVGLQRPRGTPSCTFRDAKRRECLHDLIRLEVFHVHADVIHAGARSRRSRRSGGTWIGSSSTAAAASAADEHEEHDAWTNPEAGSRRLTRAHGSAEDFLVERL